MAAGQLQFVLNHLCQKVGRNQFRDRTDAELLQCFVAARDEEAFAELVRRHGPMVLGVCRRILGDRHDAEDAFQAVFWLLARKAGSVAHGRRLAGWLYTVAYRAALEARARRRHRQEREVQMFELPQPSGPSEDLAEMLGLLDKEVRRLPEAYRAAVILCELEGHSRKDVAQRLGIPEGTLSSRLAAARKMLAQRLAWCGVILGSATLGAALADAATAVVSPALLDQTVRTARLALEPAATAAVVSIRVAAIARGVMSTMLLGKLKIAVALFVPLALVLSGLVLVGGEPTLGKAQESPPPAEAPAAQSADLPRKSQTRPEENLDPSGDLLPTGALRRFGSNTFRHTEGVIHSALATNGRYLATTGFNNSAAVWNLETGKRLQLLRRCGIASEIASENIWWEPLGKLVTLSPNGKLLAHSTITGYLARVWDATTGKEVCKVHAKPEKLVVPETPEWRFRELASALHFAGDGKSLWICSAWTCSQIKNTQQNPPSSLLLCDPSTGKVLQRRALPGRVLTFAPDAKLIAVIVGHHWAESMSVVVLETTTGKEMGRIPRNPYPGFDAPSTRLFNCAAFSPDNRSLAVTQGRLEVRVWDIATGKQRILFRHPEAERNKQLDPLNIPYQFTAITFSADGKMVFAGTGSGAIYRFDLPTGKVLPPLTGHAYFVRDLHTTPDGKRLISTAFDGTVRRWDLTNGQELPLPYGYTGQLQAAQASNGSLIAVVDSQGRLDLWDRVSGARVRTLRPAGPQHAKLVFAPDGKILATGDGDGMVRLWDTAGGGLVRSWSLLEKTDPYEPPTLLSFSPDGRHLLTGDGKKGLRLWDTATGKERWHILTATNAVGGVFAPDGKTLATGEGVCRLTFRDSATGQERFSVSVTADPKKPHATDWIHCIAFAPDGRLLATGHERKIRLWDVATGKVVLEIQAAKDTTIEALQFTPGGQWLIGTQGQALLVWDVHTGQEMLQRLHDGKVQCASLGPRGRTVLTCCGCEVLLWSLRPEDSPRAQDNWEKLWADLGSEVGKTAYRAVWAFMDDPQAAVKLLRRKVLPGPDRIDEKIQQLIADLDANHFRKRTEAARALADLGPIATSHLRAALNKPKSLEQQRRLGQLLDILKGPPSPHLMRLIRSVQVLEMADTEDGRALLQMWAGGRPDLPLTAQARAALKRLEKR